MRKRPKRLFHAEHIAEGVGIVGRMQQHVMKVKPTAAGPLKALEPPPAGAEEQPELLKAHCLQCKDKKEFAVEGKEKMSNGATRAYGKCTGGCGSTVSTFVSGSQDAG